MDTVELSFSRVQAYTRCPWMYHLIYNEGWRSGPSGPMAFGQSLHKTLEAYLSQENTEHTLDRLHELYDQLWVNEGFSSPQETLDCYDRGRKMLENFFHIDKSRQNRVEQTEKEFSVELEPGLKFRGTIDRLDRATDNSYEIIEYKTQGDKWTDERIQNDLQMTFYALGLREENKNAALKLKYYFLSSAQSKETSRSEDQLKQARALLLEVGNKVRRKEFAPNHLYCQRCEFGKRCSNFKQGTAL